MLYPVTEPATATMATTLAATRYRRPIVELDRACLIPHIQSPLKTILNSPALSCSECADVRREQHQQMREPYPFAVIPISIF